jgi:hypothetical protein
MNLSGLENKKWFSYIANMEISDKVKIKIISDLIYIFGTKEKQLNQYKKIIDEIERIYYGKDKKLAVIAYVPNKNQIWIDYEIAWKSFEKYKIDRNDIKYIISEYISDVYKIYTKNIYPVK